MPLPLPMLRVGLDGRRLMDRNQQAKLATAPRQGRYGWVWVWGVLIVFFALEVARLS